MYQEYFDLVEKHSKEYGFDKTVVLYQNGAFFEVYGLTSIAENINEIDLNYENQNDLLSPSPSLYKKSQIGEFGRLCHLSIVPKKHEYQNQRICMSGFQLHLWEKYISILTTEQFTVVVYEQEEQKSGSKRVLTGVYSPGTYFSQENNNPTSNVCSIWIDIKRPRLRSTETHLFIGASHIDTFTGETGMMEYNIPYEHTFTIFDELEKILQEWMPKETIVIYSISNAHPLITIQEIKEYIGLKNRIHLINLNEIGTEIQNSIVYRRLINCQKQIYQKEILCQSYDLDPLHYNSFIAPYEHTIYAIQSFCYLIEFMKQHQSGLVKKIKIPSTNQHNGTQMQLANQSLQQLHIIQSEESQQNNLTSKYSSVCNYLNSCCTPMGRRLFTNRLLNPIVDSSILQNRYRIIQQIMDLSPLVAPNPFSEFCLDANCSISNIRRQLYSVRDIVKFARMIIMNKISPRSIFQLYESISLIQSIYHQIRQQTELSISILNKESLDIQPFLTFMESRFDLSVCAKYDQAIKVDIEIGNGNIDNIYIQTNQDETLHSMIQQFIEKNQLLNLYRDVFSQIIQEEENKQKKKVKKIGVVDYITIHETEKQGQIFLLTTSKRASYLLTALKRIHHSTTSQSASSSSKIVVDYSFSIPEDISLTQIKCETYTDSKHIIESPVLLDLCKSISNLKKEIQHRVTEIYKQNITELNSFYDLILQSAKFISEIDWYYNGAHMAQKNHYCMPIISDNKIDTSLASSATTEELTNGSFINVKELRHCLIEKIQENEIYVTNNIALGKENENGILLYGTNAVGKTSFIRALGVSIIMAQSGLFVPATSFIFYPFKKLFTRILKKDNLFKGLSTFAIEMSELRSILQSADKHSIILGDELCSGTENISATSIFVAGIQQINQMNAKFIFATHFHEIISYDEIKNLKKVAIKHMSVYYDPITDILKYDRKLKDGPGNNMYGLEVCKSLHLPNDFLIAAESIRIKYFPITKSVLDASVSHFNKHHIVYKCKNCGNLADDVHHEYEQQFAGPDQYIHTKDGNILHKNHPANLNSLCKACHTKEHANDITTTTITETKKIKKIIRKKKI